MRLFGVLWKIVGNVFFAHVELVELQRRFDSVEWRLQAIEDHALKRNTKPAPVVRLC